MPARSDVSAGEVFDGLIITIPASLIRGEAAVAAPEQEVPITPTTCSSATMVCAAACPPSAEQRSSRPVPMVTLNPWISPKSARACSTPRWFGIPRNATSPVIAFSERIWISSPASTVTTPSEPSPRLSWCSSVAEELSLDDPLLESSSEPHAAATKAKANITPSSRRNLKFMKSPSLGVKNWRASRSVHMSV